LVVLYPPADICPGARVVDYSHFVPGWPRILAGLRYSVRASRRTAIVSANLAVRDRGIREQGASLPSMQASSSLCLPRHFERPDLYNDALIAFIEKAGR
jgi:hypothetical protein